MIISDAVFNKESGEWKHRFQVTGTTPTEASVKYDVKNSKGVTVGYKEQVIAVTKNGDYYSFSVSVPAEKYTVKLNTEPKLMEYESVENDIAKFTGDKPLRATVNYRNEITIYIPFCDIHSIKIEIFNIEGKKLEATVDGYGRARNWWKNGASNLSPTVESDAGGIKMYTKMTFKVNGIPFPLVKRYDDDYSGEWSNYLGYLTLNDAEIYLRVSGLKNLIKNDTIKIMTGAQESDCTGTYGGWIERE